MSAPVVEDLAAKQAAEEKALEACQLACVKLVESMREVMPAPAAKIKVQLDELLNSQPKLSTDFKRETLTAARVHECAANTRAADACLNEAMAKAKANDLDGRNKLVGAANAFARKALACGAAPKFQAAFDRRVEIIMMTGSGKFTVPKPADAAAAPAPPTANPKPPAATPPNPSGTPKPQAVAPARTAGGTPKPQLPTPHTSKA